MALRTRNLVACTMAFWLSACATTPIPIDHLMYRGTATVKTDMTAQVLVTSSEKGSSSSSYLMPAGGILIPVQQKTDKTPFRTEDTQAFAQSLRQELVRLAIVKAVVVQQDAPAQMRITVNIDRAMYHSDPIECTLDITMLIRGGATPFRHSYHIVSSEQDSFWEKMGTNGWEAREKLAYLMLDRLIPDIEAYGKAMTP